MKKLFFVATFMCLIWAIAGNSQQPWQTADRQLHSRKILLRNAVIDTETSNLWVHEAVATRVLDQPFWTLEDNTPDDVRRQYLVHVEDAAAEGLLERLTSALGSDGVVHDYVPHNSYLVVADANGIDRLNTLSDVLWVGDYVAEYKMDQRLLEPLPIGRDQDPLTLEFLVVLSEDPSRTEAMQRDLARQWQDALLAQGINATATWVAHQRLVVAVMEDKRDEVVLYLASRPEVYWVEPVPDNVIRNAYAAAATESFDMTKTTVWNHGIRGENQIIGVGDTGLDSTSCYFHDPAKTLVKDGRLDLTHRKIIGYNPYGDAIDVSMGHGTHVVGSIVGEAKSTSSADQTWAAQYNGMAYKAKVAFMDIGRGANLIVPYNLNTDYFPWAYSMGARIHSNSWGSDTTAYTSNARDVDMFTWNNKDFLTLFANGNNGASASGKAISPATSKNCISVGATQHTQAAWKNRCCVENPFYDCCRMNTVECNDGCSSVPVGQGANPNNIASFSSPGPSSDGRMMPLVAAPGHWIASANSDNNDGTIQCSSNWYSSQAAVIFKAGTSMATPITAGSVALIRQYLREGWYPSGTKRDADVMNSPSAALLKAMVVNSAVTMTGTHNGRALTVNDQGYGRIALSNVLQFADARDRTVYLNDTASIRSKQAHQMCVNVNSARVPFKTTLVWTDFPGALASAVALVNNLDLFVVDSRGTTTPGNANMLSGAFADSLNTVEQVTITGGITAGSVYRIIVQGTNVPQGPQPYALVVSGDLNVVSCPAMATCPSACMNRGQCVNGACVCAPNYYGVACQLGSPSPTPITSPTPSPSPSSSPMPSPTPSASPSPSPSASPKPPKPSPTPSPTPSPSASPSPTPTASPQPSPSASPSPSPSVSPSPTTPPQPSPTPTVTPAPVPTPSPSPSSSPSPSPVPVACAQRCSTVGGRCVNEQCVCNGGYSGEDCATQFCTGDVARSELNGRVASQVGASVTNAPARRCRWIMGPFANPVQVVVSVLDLGAGDAIRIYDGPNATMPLLLQVTSQTMQPVPIVMRVNKGVATVEFVSATDSNTHVGFAASWDATETAGGAGVLTPAGGWLMAVVSAALVTALTWFL